MARILVAYATRHGSTAGVAEAVSRERTAAGLEVEVAALEGYDGVVLGAPLYTGRPLDLAPFVGTGTRSSTCPLPRLRSA